MARGVTAPGKPVGRPFLLRHGQAFTAIVVLLALIHPPFGTAEEQIKWDWILGPNLKLQPTLRSGNDAGPRASDVPTPSSRTLGHGSIVRHEAALDRFKLAEKHYLTPTFSLNYDDAGGDAGKSRTADIRLSYRYLGDPLVLVVNTLIGPSGSDSLHSAFGKTRADDEFGMSASIYYTSPSDWSLLPNDTIRFFATGTYYRMASQSDASKQESASGAAGISLEW